MMNLRKPTHPGEVLQKDVIEPLGLTTEEVAKRLGVNQESLSTLLNSQSSVSPEIAIRIGKATRTTPESWLYMQAKYDLWIATQKSFEVEELTATDLV